MHEMGIASSILAATRQEAKRHLQTRIVAVGIQLGELSGVNSEALAFGFESLVKGTEFESLEIQIETIPRRNSCTACNQEFEVVDHDTVCPQCGEQRTRLISGDEIDITYFEFEA